MEADMNGKGSTIIAGGVIAALVIGAVALGAALVRPAPTQAAQAAQTGNTVVRQITVVGTGEAKAAPDRATVELGVRSDAKTAREALADNSGKMAALIGQVKQLGVAAKDIQTRNFNISPTYTQDGHTVTGYQVTNTVSVVIRNLNSAGDLLDKVVSAGANTIYGMSFDIDNPKALQEQARNAAVADARARAEAMVKAAGGTVGQIITISENIGSVQPPVIMRGVAESAATAGGAAPIETGEQTIQAQVQISYELR
jgi:uncharacterized protein YggE